MTTVIEQEQFDNALAAIRQSPDMTEVVAGATFKSSNVPDGLRGFEGGKAFSLVLSHDLPIWAFRVELLDSAGNLVDDPAHNERIGSFSDLIEQDEGSQEFANAWFALSPYEIEHVATLRLTVIDAVAEIWGQHTFDKSVLS